MWAIFIIPTFAPDGFTDFTMTVEDSVSRVGVGIVKIAYMCRKFCHIHSSDKSRHGCSEHHDLRESMF